MPACFKTSLLYLLTQKVAQKFGYVLGIGESRIVCLDNVSYLCTMMLFRIIPSLFVDKASCTRQFESELSLHSLASLFPLKESSTSNQAFSIVFTTPSVPLVGDRNLRRKDVTAPSRCSEPLRSKVGGPKRSSPCCAGWDRLTIAC